jgi:branched-chain amino acid transport system ATP-binding protein
MPLLPSTDGDRILSVEGIAASYGKRRVLHELSLDVRPGEIVTVLGHNGAGKSTLLKAIFGVVPLQGGHIHFDGRDASGDSSVARVRAGMSFTPAEAPIFRDLTVAENLALGAFTVMSGAVREERLERVFGIFPMLRDRRKQIAGTMSGGQQRMISLGIALMGGPKLMLLDEPSLGIAPGLVQEMFEQIRQLSAQEGLSVLLVEQNVRAALSLADRAYFMRAGSMILEESATAALARGKWWDLF